MLISLVRKSAQQSRIIAENEKMLSKGAEFSSFIAEQVLYKYSWFGHF